MDTTHESIVRARVAGRRAANELADLYVQEGSRINQEHGLEASIAFFETLRDNLIAIRPLTPAVAPQSEPVAPQSARGGHSADWSDCPDGYVVVEFEADVEAETELAIKVGEHWIPKSQVLDCPSEGDYVESLQVREWFAQKEGLD